MAGVGFWTYWVPEDDPDPEPELPGVLLPEYGETGLSMGVCPVLLVCPVLYD
jgi:hypothetical protein